MNGKRRNGMINIQKWEAYLEKITKDFDKYPKFYEGQIFILKQILKEAKNCDRNKHT